MSNRVTTATSIEVERRDVLELANKYLAADNAMNKAKQTYTTQMEETLACLRELHVRETRFLEKVIKAQGLELERLRPEEEEKRQH